MQICCPNCESYKVQRVLSEDGVIGFIAKSVSVMGCLMMFLVLLFPPFLLVGFAVFIVGACIAYCRDTLKGVYNYKCKNCKFRFSKNYAEDRK